MRVRRSAKPLFNGNRLHVSIGQKLDISAEGSLGICALLIVLALLTVGASAVPQLIQQNSVGALGEAIFDVTRDRTFRGHALPIPEGT